VPGYPLYLIIASRQRLPASALASDCRCPASSTSTVIARFPHDLTVLDGGSPYGGGKGRVIGPAGGVGPSCQALKRVHPSDRLFLLVIDEPLLCRPILLAVFMYTRNPSSVPLLCQVLRVQPGGLDGPKGPAGAQGRGLCRGAVDDIIHSARAVPQRRGAGQETVRYDTVTHRYTLSKAREVCGDYLKAGYHRRLPLQATRHRMPVIRSHFSYELGPCQKIKPN